MHCGHRSERRGNRLQRHFVPVPGASWCRQTVDGVPTTYVNDLSAGLTQVLEDGTETYLSGVGRIAQAAGIFNVNFTTKQTGVLSLETVGRISLLNSPSPAGVITLRGNYIGEEWKLHVLDQPMLR